MKIKVQKIDSIQHGGEKVTLRDGHGGKPMAHCAVTNNFKKQLHEAFLLADADGKAVGFLIVEAGTEMPESLVFGE